MVHFPRFTNGRLGQILFLSKPEELPRKFWQNLYLDTTIFKDSSTEQSAQVTRSRVFGISSV
jgi:hypothetical protein